jgi:ABC-2 type transport system permease protein
MSWNRQVATRSALKEELVKLPAFLRRDILTMWSYRAAFFSDWVNLLVQVLLFYFMNRLIDQSKVPTFGGQTATYIQFVAVGIAFSSFVQVSLSRVVTAIRNEQLMGTLESLLVTPTAMPTLQLGSVIYDLIYVPVRTTIFLILMSVMMNASLHVGGLGPATVVLIAFIPFSWGMGVLSAAAVLTLRRGSSFVGILGTMLTLVSGAYFPLGALPTFARSVARLNPLTLAIDAARDALLGNQGWSVVWSPVKILLPLAAASLVLGTLAFRLALRRERRKGTLFLY